MGSGDLQIKCKHVKAHTHGRLLAIIRDNSIFIKCKHTQCKRWTKLTISFPGIDLDFTKAAITQEFVSKNHRFDVADCPMVTEDACV